MKEACHKTKLLIFPLLIGFYITHLEHLKKISGLVWEFILEETKKSLRYGHLIILNILSCKHVYKKYVDMIQLKEIISNIIKAFDYEDSVIMNEYYYNNCNNENKGDNFGNIGSLSSGTKADGYKNKESSIIQKSKSSKIYTSIFNVYDSIDSFSTKNLTNLTNIKDFVSDTGKIKWNNIMFNKRKNERLISQKTKPWMHYVSELNYINDLVYISDMLRSIPLENRAEEFKNFLLFINKEMLPSYLYNPLDDSNNDHSFNKRLLKLDIDHSYSINTHERCPCLLVFEYSSPFDEEDKGSNSLENSEKRERNRDNTSNDSEGEGKETFEYSKQSLSSRNLSKSVLSNNLNIRRFERLGEDNDNDNDTKGSELFIDEGDNKSDKESGYKSQDELTKENDIIVSSAKSGKDLAYKSIVKEPYNSTSNDIKGSQKTLKLNIDSLEYDYAKSTLKTTPTNSSRNADPALKYKLNSSKKQQVKSNYMLSQSDIYQPRKSAKPKTRIKLSEPEKIQNTHQYSPAVTPKNGSVLSNFFTCNCTEEQKDDNDNEGIPTAFNSGIFGKFTFNQVKKIILNESKFTDKTLYPFKEITSSIVKGGDELRADFFVCQIIALVNSIIDELDPSLNIFMRELNILSMGNGGFIETIENSISINKINKIEFNDSLFTKLYQSKVYGNPNNEENKIPEFNLKKYFMVKYKKNSLEYHNAVMNFISSLAGYSLICYFLEIKDRNNGNILVDECGHLIHIDFGFLLSKSPGNLGFEKSPFKLTLEFVELMNGVNSNYFLKFQELFYRGFILIRKKYDLFVGVVQIFCDLFSDLKCFDNKKEIIKNLKEKFMLDVKSEDELVKRCNDIILLSVDNWRTNAYDTFQKFCVGIN